VNHVEGKKSSVNASAIRGEAGTGYEDENGLGEFECGNCKYFIGPDECTQKDMKKKSKQPRKPNGNVEVEEEGCCEYVWRVGRKDEEEEEEE